MKEIENKLENRNIKPTAMRELVLKVLSEQTAAISLADLEQTFEKVDKVTLYRTLKTFEENKLIHSIDDGSGSVKYSLCKDDCNCEVDDLHVHFYCNYCKKAFCLENVTIPKFELPDNMKIESLNFVIKGYCGKCNQFAT